MSYVETPRESRFGGLILPQDTLQGMIRAELASAYGATTRTNRATVGWDVSMGSADADSIPHIDPLRWQARDLDRNNPLAAGSLDTIVDNVVATGLRPQSAIDRAILQLSDEEVSAKQTEFERFFFLWAGHRNSDVTRTSNFWEQQALVLLNTLLSGDLFTIRRFKRRPGWVFGTCVQLVEADRAQTPPERMGPQDRTHGGVEVDADGEAIRYHFLREHPGSLTRVNMHEYTSVPAHDATGVPLCLHHFIRRRPDQHRGVSVLAPVIEPFKQLGRFTDAELAAAVLAGMFSVFVKTPMATSPLSAATVPGQVNGTNVTPTGTSLTKLRSGMIVDLAPGEDIEFANPNRPSTSFDPFVQAILKQIGAGLGLPHEVMTKHFTASYSASRAAIMEAWKSFRRRRQWLASSFCQPVYEWVISEAVALGYIDAPGFFDDPLRRAAWLGTTWRGAPMGQLDPYKEARAAKEWLSIPGATTIQNIAAEQFGSDWEDNMDQTARERTRMAALPADPMAPPAPAQAAEQQEGAPENE